MYLTRHVVTLAMDTSTLGTATAYSEPVNGYVHSIRYIHSTSGGLSTTCHLKVTGEASGLPILGELPNFTTGDSKTYYPRVDTCGTTGGFNNYTTAAAELERIKDKVGLAQERVKLEITTSSSTGVETWSGVFHILVGG